jgi:hypothetical protein
LRENQRWKIEEEIGDFLVFLAGRMKKEKKENKKTFVLFSRAMKLTAGRSMGHRYRVFGITTQGVTECTLNFFCC